MFFRRYRLIILLVICLFITNCAFAKIKPHEKYMGEATVKVGELWIINTPADFDATNCDIVERYKSNGVRFTQVGDTIVTAYYWDQTNPRKSILYSQTKKFHVIPSEEYGESIKIPVSDNNYAQEMLLLLNKKRVAAGLEPLILDDELCKKAQIRAQHISLTLGIVEFYLMDGKVPILNDKNYKFIDETFTFGYTGLETPTEFAVQIFDKKTNSGSIEPIDKLMNKKAKYFGMGLTMDTNHHYYWSFLFADKKN